MVTVAVLSADQRLSFQIHTWLKELADTIRWETHPDLAAFAKKIETEIAAELIEQSKSSDDAILDAEDIGAGKSKEIKDAFYRLLVVDLDLLHANNVSPIEWTRKLKKLMGEKERSDPMFPVRVLFLAFEGGGFKADSLRDIEIDDLALKPLDRSVFLQKIEFLTSDKPNIKPTFLFRQATNIWIEIGKDAVIDEISEFSMAIRNPTPLANGVFAAVHCSVFGGGELARVIGRVYKSEPHPSIVGVYLVRFAFFGLNTDQLNNVKKFVRERQPPPRSHRPQGPSMSDNDPEVPFNRIAVIDMNGDVFNEIESTMKDHYVGVQSTHYLSYARFLATLKGLYPTSLQLKVNADQAAAAVAAHHEPVDDTHGMKAWTASSNVALTILSTSQELVRFESSLASGDTIFGRTRLEWTERPTEFFSGLDKQDANEMNEMINYAVSGAGQGRAFLKMKDQQKRTYYVEATANLAKLVEGEEPSLVHVELSQIDKAAYEKNAGHSRQAEKKIEPADLMYDAIYIDVNLIRGDLQPWYDGLTEAYLKAGVINPGGPMPKIILLADEKAKTRPDAYRNKIVSDFLYKPLDRKVLSFKAKIAVNELIPRKEQETTPFVRAEMNAKLAKDAMMEELSEYGLSIAHKTPFKRGAMVRFFSPLLSADAEGVLARCAYCEQKEEKEISYTCNFMFFGTPDENLKRIRTWIREDYVQRKEAP